MDSSTLTSYPREDVALTDVRTGNSTPPPPTPLVKETLLSLFEGEEEARLEKRVVNALG